MRKAIIGLLGSFTTDKDGWSARKLSAFAGVATAVIITFRLPINQFINAVYAWQTFALVCLGIVTAEQIINFIFNIKNPK